MIQPRKVAELVADHLRGEIVSGVRSIGSTLPVERELIEAYGVSRPTLREALRILETEGLLKVTRGVTGGATVIGPSLTLATHAVGMILQAKGTHLVDVQVARSIIEPPAVRMLAANRSEDDLRVLREVLDVERAMLSGSEFPFAAMQFHETLMARCGNDTINVFSQILHEIHQGAAIMFSSVGNVKGSWRRTLNAHEVLLQLIEDRHGVAAESHWREYWAPYLTRRGPGVVDVLKMRS